MIINHSRLSILSVGISVSLMLSACQSANEPLATTEEAHNETTTVDSHANHDMSATTSTDSMSTDTTPISRQTTNTMLEDYSDSMTAMHKEMMLGARYNDPDSAFAKGMIGHHTGALAMANIELKYGTDKQMRNLAQEIIKAQQSELKQLQSWLDSHPDVAKPMAETKAMQQAYIDGMTAMHGEMALGIADPVPDIAFARGMLPHHKGAVAMARVQLEYGKDAEMLQLAQNIIDTQQPEIEHMQNWIKANKGAIPSAQ